MTLSNRPKAKSEKRKTEKAKRRSPSPGASISNISNGHVYGHGSVVDIETTHVGCSMELPQRLMNITSKSLVYIVALN